MMDHLQIVNHVKINVNNVFLQLLELNFIFNLKTRLQMLFMIKYLIRFLYKLLITLHGAQILVINNLEHFI